MFDVIRSELEEIEGALLEGSAAGAAYRLRCLIRAIDRLCSGEVPEELASLLESLKGGAL